MTQFLRDRRLVGRYNMKTPLRVRLWKSTNPEQAAESVNVSRQGIYFATNSVLHEGETVEVFFNMPEIVLGEPASEWRCTGHVVRVEAIAATGGNLGVGVQFDCYEVSRARPADRSTGMAMPQGMIADTRSRTNQEDGVAVGTSVGSAVELGGRRNFR